MSNWLTIAADSFFRLAQPDPTSGPAGAAAAAASEGAGAAGGGGMGQLLIFGAIFVVFWLLILRPQQKRAKEHQGFVESLKAGTRVVTSSGIFGKVTSIDGATVELEIAPKVTIKLLKSQIAGLEGQAAKAVANANAR